jgi:hypothetical protein
VGDQESRLLAEADYVYDFENWETTYDDVGTLSDEGDLNFQYSGEITAIGRLKALPLAYAVNMPVSFDDDGDPDDWEVQVFETREAAAEAFRAALAGSPSQ